MIPECPSIRILIADDHPLFRDGLRMLLSAESGFEVLAAAPDGEQAIEMCRRLMPDVLLLDVSMPRFSGLDVLTRVTAECPAVRTILLTASLDRRQTVEALTNGARGVVMKDTASEVLFRSIKDVVAFGYWLAERTVDEIVGALQEKRSPCEGDASPLPLLTTRERQIISAVAQGATNDDIGRQFGLRPQTVKNHLTSIFDKVGVANRLELALFAVSHRLVEAPPPFAAA